MAALCRSTNSMRGAADSEGEESNGVKASFWSLVQKDAHEHAVTHVRLRLIMLHGPGSSPPGLDG